MPIALFKPCYCIPGWGVCMCVGQALQKENSTGHPFPWGTLNESSKGVNNCFKTQGMLSLEKGEEKHQNTGKANYFKQSIPKTIPNLLKIPIKIGEGGEGREER